MISEQPGQVPRRRIRGIDQGPLGAVGRLVVGRVAQPGRVIDLASAEGGQGLAHVELKQPRHPAARTAAAGRLRVSVACVGPSRLDWPVDIEPTIVRTLPIGVSVIGINIVGTGSVSTGLVGTGSVGTRQVIAGSIGRW